MQIRCTKSEDKPYTLGDRQGLSLFIEPNGSKRWRFRYRFVGKPKMISPGVYPTITPADARSRRDDARKLLAEGNNPSKVRIEQKIALQEGVYAQLTGPSYETPAEVELLRRLGADAVGMSTAVEAVAAKHMGMRICGISCISNLAAGMTKQPLSHEEVQAAADSAAPKFQKLVTESIQAFYRE